MALSEPGLSGELIEIRVKGRGILLAEAGVTAEKFISRMENIPHKIVGVTVDNELKDLHHIFDRSCAIEMVDVTSELGMRVYRNTGIFIMVKACHELFPDRKLIVKHSLSNGLFCEFKDRETNAWEVQAIEQRMKEIVARDFPIVKHRVSREEATSIFTRQNQPEKVDLFSYWHKDYFIIQEIDGLFDYFYGILLPRTGFLTHFKVLDYPPGLVLQTLEPDSPDSISPWVERPKLFAMFDEAKDWADMMDVETAFNLNHHIEKGNIENLIRINEALHEKKIAWIADQICSNPRLRLILIAGPSSSGKSTFAKRLFIQLRVNGRRPVTISLDNYYRDRETRPRDADGEYDFESLDALKVDLFNEHLNRLIAGEKVEMPVYNFKTGCCEPEGVVVQVPKKELIIVEGIHGLNEQMTWRIPKVQKFKIYISALTQLNFDYINRIPTTDLRLIRRIVRDNRARSLTPLETIRRWPSVRRGEEKNIFPFQEEADVMFNSSLTYELAVLKDMVEPHLQSIGKEHPEYLHSRRIQVAFAYLRSIPPGVVPPNSILREFIGGSCFNV